MKFIYRNEFNSENYKVFSGYIQNEDGTNKGFRYYKTTTDYIMIEKENNRWFDGTDTLEGQSIIKNINEKEKNKTL